MNSWENAAPEEKRSAFYGQNGHCGRGKHDGRTIAEEGANKLTFKSMFVRRLLLFNGHEKARRSGLFLRRWQPLRSVVAAHDAEQLQ
ncbi:hypothetical protein EMIT047CA2_90206 [Pseudomonas soli]